ncbi:hypothetical protein [cf. Phormidesmis sp. LEGE 11477]|uniref:hypothetical protein n=1 Tax=cf. Phormidesmis sp. LEGE 11477 TaxID=1828680 RepID=UPI0018801096|nr:hypothetical protein [cf. Phormidesmis sp. LEGE 11477]MBE9062485.1 hypothetical protein [cf. Phormidesmis sp. LEGE 11477]
MLKSKQIKRSSAARHLLLIKVSLAFFLLGISVVARRETTWPIISWILYSGYTARFRPPEPTASALELRAYTVDGDLHIVKPEQLLSVPYDSLSYDIVEQAFTDDDIDVRDASRAYLTGAVSKQIDAQIETIQAWTLSYPVEPLEVPPIQRQFPAAEVMIGSFLAEDTAQANE